jgi:hypothetical protein
MRSIFRMAISLGLTTQKTGTKRGATVDEICDGFFETCLRIAREEKPSSKSTEKLCAEMVEAWVKRGRRMDDPERPFFEQDDSGNWRTLR